jgi:hypothetical protein
MTAELDLFFFLGIALSLVLLSIRRRRTQKEGGEPAEADMRSRFGVIMRYLH